MASYSNIVTLGPICLFLLFITLGSSLVAQMVKHLPAKRETWVRPLDWEDPLEQEMAAHFGILAWKVTWTEELGGLQFMGSQNSQTQLSY